MLAVAAGAVAATGAGMLLDVMDSPDAEYIITSDNEAPEEMTYDLEAFDEINSVGPQDIVITQGEEFSIRSEGSPAALRQLEVVVRGDELSIQPRDGAFRGDWGSLESATFHITLPLLERLALAGSGEIRIDRIEGDSFQGVVAGPGEILIADMQVDEADFGIFGSGDLSVAGAARDTRITIGGSGAVEGGGLRSENASVSIGGSGDVSLTVDDEADISIAGSGDVDILGSAQCSVTRMGGGEVRCAGGGGD